MGEFLQDSGYIFDDLIHQETTDSYAAEILAANDTSEESDYQLSNGDDTIE